MIRLNLVQGALRTSSVHSVKPGFNGVQVPVRGFLKDLKSWAKGDLADIHMDLRQKDTLTDPMSRRGCALYLWGSTEYRLRDRIRVGLKKLTRRPLPITLFKKPVNKPRLVRIPGSEGVRHAALSNAHGILCTDSGKVYTFGHNLQGELGRGFEIESAKDGSVYEDTWTLSADAPPAKSVHAAEGRSVILSEIGELWGTTPEGMWKKIPTSEDITHVSTTGRTIIAFDVNGRGRRLTPSGAIAELVDLQGASEDMIGGVAVTSSGKLVTYGLDKGGRLGRANIVMPQAGEQRHAAASIEAPNMDSYARVALGHRHGVATTRTGRVFQWGTNLLRDDIPVEAPRSPDVPQPKAIEVAAGYYWSMLLNVDGTVMTWGNSMLGARHKGIEFIPDVGPDTKYGRAVDICGSLHAAGFLVQRKKKVKAPADTEASPQA